MIYFSNHCLNAEVIIFEVVVYNKSNLRFHSLAFMKQLVTYKGGAFITAIDFEENSNFEYEFPERFAS